MLASIPLQDWFLDPLVGYACLRALPSPPQPSYFPPFALGRQIIQARQICYKFPTPRSLFPLQETREYEVSI